MSTITHTLIRVVAQVRAGWANIARGEHPDNGDELREDELRFELMKGLV